MRLSVGSLVNGSITAVLGSGITSMSLDSIDCQPRIDEPSNPSPSSKGPSSLNSEIGAVKCCHWPRRSMNLISTITAPFSLIICRTCFGVIESLILLAAFKGKATPRWKLFCLTDANNPRPTTIRDSKSYHSREKSRRENSGGRIRFLSRNPPPTQRPPNRHLLPDSACRRENPWLIDLLPYPIFLAFVSSSSRIAQPRPKESKVDAEHCKLHYELSPYSGNRRARIMRARRASQAALRPPAGGKPGLERVNERSQQRILSSP